MSTFSFTLNELQTATGGEWLRPVDKRKTITALKTDSREDCRASLFIALPGETFDGHDFIPKAVALGAPCICIDKKHLDKAPADIDVLVVNDTVRAYQDIAFFYRKKLTDLKVAAVTGSNGKTSTKEMLRAVFAEAFGKDAVLATEGNTNNHVGVPQNILKLTENHKIAILEMGTNHSGEIEPLCRIAMPCISVICSVGKAHIENFLTEEAIAAEKSEIFSHLDKQGTAVMPAAHPQDAVLMKKASQFNLLKFGQSPDADVTAKYLSGNLYGSSFELNFKKLGVTKKIMWKLSGLHHANNAAAAACAGLAAGISPDIIAAGLEKCVLPGMRMRISDKNGTIWINDAYNANPDSMQAGLEWLAEFIDSRKLILALGDMRELGNTSDEAHEKILSLAVEKFPGAKIVVVGNAMCKTAANDAFKNKVCAFKTSADAVDHVRKNAVQGTSVYLKASRGTKLEIIEPA
jgi:UDP-N-acetylmuramoyl-tripeptide--D-alanyl-D-alanine ligase